MGTAVTGRVWKFGDHVCGDDGIIEYELVRGGFGKPFDEDALRDVCFRKLRPEFKAEVRPGDIVVGGINFAHHNHVEVPAAMKASGISVVVVESCETGFIRRALNLGLPVLLCPGIAGFAEDGDRLSVDPATGTVEKEDGAVLTCRPMSPRMVAIWQAGGVVPLLAEEFAAARTGG
ncbi:hypothetical protein HKCCE2091_03405 [Rhodobacterales bacterium HKCCE2091]|nr:hypothetical protein [Rhodobacterales bacterium HKCCE2091]